MNDQVTLNEACAMNSLIQITDDETYQRTTGACMELYTVCSLQYDL